MTIENLGDKIKKLRTELGWSQKDLADKVNLAFVTISQYETGRRTPDLETLKKIATVFDVPVTYLITDNEQIPDKITEMDSSKSMAVMIIETLIRENKLDPTKDIPQTTVDMILTALKDDIRKVQEEEKSKNKKVSE